MDATMNIKERMEVVGSDGAHIGTVDHIDGQNRIKLTRDDSRDGRHHFVPTNWVTRVDNSVHLRMPADEVFGQLQ